MRSLPLRVRPPARARSARLALQHWLRLTQRHGSLVRAFTGDSPLARQQHYPAHDLIDRRNGSQCYYHCHRGDGEHGHLHLFRRSQAGLPLTHLIAISLDPRGLPVAFFSVNRWVSDDRWLPAPASLRLLEGMRLRGEGIDPHLGGWLVHFLRFYQPITAQVLLQRDHRLHGSADTGSAALASRELEVPSWCPIDWIADLEALEAMAPQGRESVDQSEAGPQPHPQGGTQQGEPDP